MNYFAGAAISFRYAALNVTFAFAIGSSVG
jgi:hypothetical protein